MTDNEIMTLDKALFILRHGSAEGEHKYFEAIEIIENEINRQKAEIERLQSMNKDKLDMIHDLQAEIERLNDELKTMKAYIAQNKLEWSAVSFLRFYKNLKVEAIKEFSDLIKRTATITATSYHGEVAEETYTITQKELDGILQRMGVAE